MGARVATPGGVGLVATEFGWNVTASGTHTFKGKIAVGAVDFTLVCDGNAQRHTYRDWVDITVTGESSASCPADDQASISQDRTRYGCYYTDDQKKLFRTLAKIAHDGYVVDKAIDGVISIPEDFITDKFTGKGLVTEFVVGKFWGEWVERKILPKIPNFGKLPEFKRLPYNQILDAAKYAAWLDFSKYWVLSRLADDPPDPNFESLARPPALDGIPHALPALGDSERREVALYVAMLTTVERAAGAEVADNADAEARQLRHASALANRLVSLLGAREHALRRAAKVVRRMPVLHLPRGLVRRTARRLDGAEAARFERNALGMLGFTTEYIQAVGNVAPAVKVDDFTRPLHRVLGLRAEADVVARQRAALAAFANRYALGGR